MTRRIRRAPAAIALAVAATLVLAACSGDTDPVADDDTASSEGATTPAGPFEYTDGRGETVTLDEVPQTVVAQSSVAAALWDAGYQVDGVYGELAEVDGELNYQAGDIDLDEVENLGATYGEFKIEQYGLLDPDLLIDYTFDGETLWYVPAEQSEQVFELAPSIGIDGNNFPTTDDAIEVFVDLAGRLGADVESDELAEDKEAYEAALEDISATAGDSELQAVFVSADADLANFYIGDQKFFPELNTPAEAGLDIIAPKTGKAEHFHVISPEQLPDYAEADVIFFDARTLDLVKGELENVDTWASLPAVEAGQVYPWYAAAPYSYAAYGDIYQEMADQLAGAEVLD